jgi:hypothetical protein
MKKEGHHQDFRVDVGIVQGTIRQRLERIVVAGSDPGLSPHPRIGVAGRPIGR